MFCRLQHHILQQFLLLSCGTTTSKMKWKSKNSKKKKRRGASHSMEISHLSKIHFSLDPLKERSAEYHHVTDLVAEQRAFWQKKKIAIKIGLSLFHNSLRKRVSVKRGAGVGVYLFFFFFRECCFRVRVMVRLELFRVRVRFRVRGRVRVSVNPNPNPKTTFFKKR